MPNYKDMATLEAALKAVAAKTLGDSGSSNYSSGSTVNGVACIVGTTMTGGSKLVSCTVHLSDGTSFSTPVIVSSDGLSYTDGGGTTRANRRAK